MNNTRTYTLAAMFLALALVLPFITGQIPEIGQLLTPMHFPIFFTAIFVGPKLGTIVGFIAPLLRFLLFGMPMFPMAISMSFELATYALVIGIVYQLLRNTNLNATVTIVISLLVAMIIGRLSFSLAALVFIGSAKNLFVVYLSTITSSSIGIILQLILIPIITIRLKDNVNLKF